jgi:hypothetical protein
MVAAFLCYTGMYAVRKSFLAGQYLDSSFHGMHFKTVLVISQVIGYMLSKFLGIKYVSELKERQRTGMLVSLVSFGLLMLLAFAFVPKPFKPITLFLNGLPLGMVFGVVLSYLEGRRQTELLIAALSATFIFSTGLIKTTGVWLLQSFSVNEYLMPFLTGLCFFPFFLIAVWMLQRAKVRDPKDIEYRSARSPMLLKERMDFLRQHGLIFLSLVMIYILLTIIRDFRDNFIVEFWTELGYANQPALITLTEIPVALIVLILSALGVLIYNNRIAFNISLWSIGIAAVFMLVYTFLLIKDQITPVVWMIATGTGVYLPYILFHCLVFERLIALLRFKGNIGFLFYIADSLGYAGSVAIMLFKELGQFQLTWVNFFVQLNLFAATLILLLTLTTWILLKVKLHQKAPHEK